MSTLEVNRPRHDLPKRVLLLLTARTYRAAAFVRAATRLGIDVVRGYDMHPRLAERWQVKLGLDYQEPDRAAEAIAAFARETPLGAIMAVDDAGTLVAAKAAARLGLPHNAPEAAEAARDKARMRELLARHGVPAPRAKKHYFRGGDSVKDLPAIAAHLPYPVVLKPLNLSGSRGVMRADDPESFIEAAQRLQQLLEQLDPVPGPKPYLVEQYVPGEEVALEGLLVDGRLEILALFDKPDPLEGPYFEESIYVTPSQLTGRDQLAVRSVTARAAEALGLRHGPIHAELRLNDAGPWLIEVAGRSIGGLCSETLRFGPGRSLEELILRQAFGMELGDLSPAATAGGVMMIPIPEAGLLKGVHGCEDAQAVPLVESVEITARLNYPLIPLPEGDSYLGFIFARGESPASVEAALREAHSKLSFDIAPQITLRVTGNGGQ